MLGEFTTFGDKEKASMAMHGTVPPYVPGKEEWSSYAERLTHYFIANGVDDATKQRSILLSNCGATTTS